MQTKQTMKNRLEKVAEFDGMTLYKRVASNGSSAWAWVGGPPYVLTNSKGEVIGEFDWHSDAVGALHRTEPCEHGYKGKCLLCSSPEFMAKKQSGVCEHCGGYKEDLCMCAKESEA